jgi:ADP-ribose pyrophosphatase
MFFPPPMWYHNEKYNHGKEPTPMELKETMLRTQEVYRGKIVRVRRDTVRLPNGREALREVVEHPGGVAILALDDKGRVPLVRQYRYAMGRAMWELPAGKREQGEDPFLTARRELHEEIGATAEEWLPLGKMVASPGCYNEELYLFLARKLTFGAPQPEADEFLDAERIPFSELVHRCLDGEIEDSKTIAATLKAKLLLDL